MRLPYRSGDEYRSCFDNVKGKLHITRHRALLEMSPKLCRNLRPHHCHAGVHARSRALRIAVRQFSCRLPCALRRPRSGRRPSPDVSQAVACLEVIRGLQRSRPCGRHLRSASTRGGTGKRLRSVVASAWRSSDGSGGIRRAQRCMSRRNPSAEGRPEPGAAIDRVTRLHQRRTVVGGGPAVAPLRGQLRRDRTPFAERMRARPLDRQAPIVLATPRVDRGARAALRRR